MQVRYRYRLYPAPRQRQALARAFGCARVVYNDCVRVRDEAYAAGEKISDTEVQRRVITLRDIEGLGADETRELLDLSDGNQRVLLHRARSKVRQALEEYLA